MKNIYLKPIFTGQWTQSTFLLDDAKKFFFNSLKNNFLFKIEPKISGKDEIDTNFSKPICGKSGKVGKQEKVIKCSLQSILIEKRLTEVILNHVHSVSQAVQKGSLVFNLYLLHCLQNDLPLSDKLDKTSFYQTCILMGECRGKIPGELVYVFQTYFQNYPRIPRVDNDTGLYNLAAINYKTVFMNSLFMPFWGRQKRYIEAYCKKNGIHKDWINPIIAHIRGWGQGINTQLPEDLVDFVANEKEFLPDPQITDLWLKGHMYEVLHYYYHILNYCDQFPDVRKFTLAPVHRIKSHFITIDTKVLYGLLKERFDIEEVNEAEFRANSQEHWNNCFDLSKLADSREFTGTIQTDGVSASVHYCVPRTEEPVLKGRGRKKKVPIQEPSPQDRQAQRVIGIDPGKTNLIFGVEVLPNGKVKKYRLTNKTYYNQSGMNKATENSAKWEKEIEVEEKIFARVDLKTTRIDKWVEFLRNYLSVYSTLWKVKTEKKWAQQRFRVYCLKQRTLDNFFNTMNGPVKPVIAYGAAKFSPNGNGQISAPTTSLFKKCSQKFKTYPVDEFLTTQICHDCDSHLHEVVKDQHPVQMKAKAMVGPLAKWRVQRDQKVRGLRWCSTSCRSFKNRDLNAALNILRCFTNEHRPQHLSRNFGGNLGKPKKLKLTR